MSLRGDELGSGTMPSAPYYPIGEQVINITPDMQAIAVSLGDPSLNKRRMYPRANDTLNEEQVRRAASPLSMTSDSLANTRALLNAYEGEIAVIDSYEYYLQTSVGGKKGLMPGRRRADAASQGRQEQACLPIKTILSTASFPADLKPDVEPGVDHKLDRMRCAALENRLQFVCIVKSPDSAADFSGNTTGHVSGPVSTKNFGFKTIYQGQLIAFRAPTPDELLRCKGDRMMKNGTRPILIPYPVDWAEHDLGHADSLTRALGSINRELDAAGARPLANKADYETVFSQLERYDHAVADLVVALAFFQGTIAWAGAPAAGPRIPPYDAPTGAMAAQAVAADYVGAQTGAYHLADGMFSALHRELTTQTTVAPPNGPLDSQIGACLRQNVTRLVGCIRAMEVRFDRTIFARAEETIEPGQTGRSHTFFFA